MKAAGEFTGYTSITAFNLRISRICGSIADDPDGRAAIRLDCGVNSGSSFPKVFLHGLPRSSSRLLSWRRASNQVGTQAPKKGLVQHCPLMYSPNTDCSRIGPSTPVVF